MFSRFSSNSEANATELPEKFEIFSHIMACNPSQKGNYEFFISDFFSRLDTPVTWLPACHTRSIFLQRKIEVLLLLPLYG